jgi:hypothetical protein
MDSSVSRQRTLSQATTFSISEELARDAIELVKESRWTSDQLHCAITEVAAQRIVKLEARAKSLEKKLRQHGIEP